MFGKTKKHNPLYTNNYIILIIGIISILFYACEHDYLVESYYFYTNKTSKTIKMSVYGKNIFIADYTILPSETLLIKNKKEEGGSGPFTYPDIKKTNVLPGDSIYITFDNETYTICTRKVRTNTNLLFSSIYRRVEIDDNEDRSYYDFTEKDFENAIPIQSEE